ncbi:MAG: class I SAM-dependent methyltransferase [Shewanella sp.]
MHLLPLVPLTASPTALAPAPLISGFAWPPLAGLRVADIACGSGRNGAWFCERGAHVTFIDKDLSALSPLISPSAARWQWDLEQPDSPRLPAETFDIVLVFNYLHRPLLAQIGQSLKPRGLIVYETFTRQQASIGRPRNPDFLLTENELKSVFANFQPLHYFEGRLVDAQSGRASFKAQLIAQKP